MQYPKIKLALGSSPVFLGRAALISAACHAAILTGLALSISVAVSSPRAGQEILAERLNSVAADDLSELSTADFAVSSAGHGLEAQFNPLPDHAAEVLGVAAALLEEGLASPASFAGIDSMSPLELLSATPAESGETRGRASFYDIPAVGDNFVFIVDMSGSMQGGRFRRARGELKRSLEALGASQRFFVVFFSNRDLPMPAPGLLNASPDNLKQSLQWIRQVQPGGFTAPASAVARALDLKPDAVYLLSDGEFDLEAVERILPEAGSVQVPIHTIGFSNRQGERMLKAIAERTGGVYRHVR